MVDKLPSIILFSLFVCSTIYNIFQTEKIYKQVSRRRTEKENSWQKEYYLKTQREWRAWKVQETESRSVELKLEEGMTTGRWCKVGKELRPGSLGQIIMRKLLKGVYISF